jgi:uncharacterized membrane protein
VRGQEITMATQKPKSATDSRYETRHIGTWYFLAGLAVGTVATLLGLLFEQFPAECTTLAAVIAVVLGALLCRPGEGKRSTNSSRMSRELRAFPLAQDRVLRGRRGSHRFV